MFEDLFIPPFFSLFLLCACNTFVGFVPQFLNNIYIYLYRHLLHSFTFWFHNALFSTVVSNRIRVEKNQGLLSSLTVCIICMLQRVVNIFT